MSTRAQKGTGQTSGPTKRKAPEKSKGKQQKGGRDEESNDPNRFKGEAERKRYEEIADWGFNCEKRVELKPGECDEFVTNLLHRKWHVLNELNPKYDPIIVKEFYANAIIPAPDKMDSYFERRSEVRGKVVVYAESAIENFLEHPRVPNSRDSYSHKKNNGEFVVSETVAALCFPNYGAAKSKGEGKVIPRPHLTRLAKLWAAYLISNITPKGHVNTFPMDDCHFIACLMDKDQPINVSWHISNSILLNVMKKGSKQLLGFPSLITTLCENAGIPVNRTKSIRQPFNTAYLRDHVSALPPDAEVPAPAPVPVPTNIAELYGSMTQSFQGLNMRLDKQDMDNAHSHLQMSALNRKLDLLYKSQYDYATFSTAFPPLATFESMGNWPGDVPNYPEGVGYHGGQQAFGGGGHGAGASGAGGSGTGGANQGDDDEMAREMEEDEDYNPLIF